MKRFLLLILAFLLCLPLITACDGNDTPVRIPEKERLRLSSFVGVWTNDAADRYYRFTPESRWFYYNVNGEVERKGEVSFDGKIFTLTSDALVEETLSVEDGGFRDHEGNLYHRTDSPSSLISSVEYEAYFSVWYEESNLEGNTLTILEPDTWSLNDPEGELLCHGSFYAYADESDFLYLYHEKDNSFYARLSMEGENLMLEQPVADRATRTLFSTAENSTVRYFYFKDKNVSCDYELDSGMRLLRNGGAAYNDAHDYKKMPVTCRIDTVSDQLNESGERELAVSVTYEFKHTDLPYLSGGIVYNSVRFSQYDYYTGELFYLDDSTGNENLISTWVTEHDGVIYEIDCSFTSEWVYTNSKEILARWHGTYNLTMPADYDGFVICLRPVYNSYSAQIATSIVPEEGTLMMEDVGDDVEKSIFCRVPKFAQKFDQQTLD